jgi:nucleotide-binding universal stress UspA family protein
MSSPALPEQPLPLTYRVVVGVDFSEHSARAIRAALDLALHRETQIFAITVAEGFGVARPKTEATEMHDTFHDETQKTLERYLSDQLDDLEKGGAKLNRKRVAAAVDFGKPAESILAFADSVKADLIVIGTHGKKGLERLVLGSVATSILRTARCPVLVTV